MQERTFKIGNQQQLLLLLMIINSIFIIQVTYCEKVINYKEIKESRLWRLSESPIIVKNDILITPEGHLTIEAGTEVRFAPEVGITVRGILTAVGTKTDKIKFTSREFTDLLQQNRTIRLVDGIGPQEGIIQIYDLGRWRSVCTNSRNWTLTDMQVACRQLGFAGGEWYHWYPHLNDTRQMLYQEPGCNGNERRVDLCNWHRRKMGSGVCDHHPNLGLRCLPFYHESNHQAAKHWRGLRFESAPYNKDLTQENTLYVSSSKSELIHVEVTGAGRGFYKGRPNTTSAVESWGVPPTMENILIDNSAYNGINITSPGSIVVIRNANITNNRGYGLYVNTTTGYVTLQDSSVTNNMADGIKYHFHDQRPETKVVDGVDVHDFCTYSTTYSQTYPFMMVAEQYEDSSVERVCGKRFYTKHGYILTLHFTHLMSAINDAATLEIRDGSDRNSRLIKTVEIKNYTRPESVVSTGNNMFILFKADREVKTELFLEITVGKSKAYDLNVSNTEIIGNSGRGVWVEKMRSAVHIHKSKIRHHNYVAGFNVNWGAGDVNITHSEISYNWVDGVNITYGGGNRNVSWSNLSSNIGKGFALYINETTVNNPVRQETVIAYSNINLNHDIGVLVGNFCGPSIVNISGNYFESGNYFGLEVLSCWKDTDVPGNMLLQIGHNHFINNNQVAIKLSPLVRAIGKIEHNDFELNKRGCIYIKNEDDFILEIQPVDLLIFENRFLDNQGAFVLNLGLSHYDFLHLQTLLMKNNWVQNNLISEPWLGLNPRSQVAAPVVISSDNVKLVRNLIDNPSSRYEIGSHLIEPNTILDCRNNWLGDKDEKRVWSRIFDRDDRYNLAKVEYIPYLLSNNINTELVLERPEWEPQFLDSKTREVGGEVTGVEELREDGVYIVRRDINVRPEGRLKITPGVTLKFEHSIGLMVSGEIIAEGDLQGGQPVLTLLDSVRENVSSVPLKLVGGKTVREGRLQVEIDGQWGTVCNFGWTIESAALACQQMGWVLNPEDWYILPNETPKAGNSDPIKLSNVRCGPLDTDITKCKLSETREEFLNSCTHEDDVGLKCYDVSWAGMRLGMTAKRSKLYDVKVERAGLLDYRTYQFSPAIQADFTHHVFEHLHISDNDHDGMGILYSDIYYPDDVNFIKQSKITNNKRHGISFRQLGMNIKDTEIRDNFQSGIHHDAKLDKLEQRELTEWMSLIDEGQPGTIIKIPESDKGSNVDDPIIIPEDQSRLIISNKANDVNSVYHIRSERDEFVIGMQLINPFHNYTTEQMTIYDYRHVKIDPLIETWNVSRDIASFPMISSSYAITLEYKSGKAPLGNLMLLLTPIHCANLPGNCNPGAHHINPLHRSKIVPGSFPRLTIMKSSISHNKQGLSVLHYNRYLGHDSQVYLRKANESIEIFDCEISSNREDAFYVFTPFRELNQFNISEITYMINRTRFLDNGRGIFQYSKDLRDSNNLYHWVLRENLFELNGGGGFDVALPYVWQYNENYTHTVHMDSNIIKHNKNFDITIRGHFARVYILNNTIFDNFCHQGLIALRGMEKECWIFANNIQNNNGIYMVEFDMDSHSDIKGFVDAYFTQNVVQNNKHSHHLYEHAYHPASYTLAVKGVQKFNITDNLFGNEGLDYELLAGIHTARVSNYLNAERNYWGTSNIDVIRQKLFDFDDWNSYAVTHFLPYLLQSDFESPVSSSYEQDPKIDLDNLGGRLYESIRLVARPYRPYVIKSDLTVMHDVTLTIDPGAELEFYPSVGILVLGTLHAQGNIDQNIVFRPVDVDKIHDYRLGGISKYEDASSSHPNDRHRRNSGNHYFRLNEDEDFDVRLCQADRNGTICPEGANQGFVEIFNRTTMQWIPMCDHRFSERNAQVVCRQLGFSDLNIFLDFDIRNEYHAQSLNRIIYWPEPYQCTGIEERLSHCPLRMNGQIYGHQYGCNWKGSDFAFVHCGSKNLEDNHEYWGGIRFSVKEFEQELFHAHIHDAVTHTSSHKHESILQYVQIIGAGILHGEKSPAVQAIMMSPLLSSINISHCAHDGINLISPSKTMNMLYNKIEHNLGVGISAAVLSGEVREATLSTFNPLENIPIPYHNFGLVDICDPQKEIVIEERILLYYKYDNNPVDCVKIFASIYDVKPIGFRLLHYNFVNSSGEPWIPDHLTLYDGDLYNRTTNPIVTIKVDGQEKERKLYQTTRNNALSIKFHATGAREHMGFVAEVVTLPISVVGIDRDIKHNMSFSVFHNNQKGAIHYTSAGEINPILTLQRNQFSENCVSLYGNFSTCQSTIILDIQNTQDVFFHNNFISRNIGGLFLKAGSSGTATALRGLFHNNVFEENVKKTTLHLEGRQTSPYQQITMYKNYFTRNDIAHESVMSLYQVLCNASYNTIHNNRGKAILEVTGFANVRLPIYQSFTHNGFYNNEAYGDHCDRTSLGRCRYGIRATVVAGSAGQEYVDNIFYNRNNDYELITLNRSEWDVWKTPINAKYNYWAYNETVAVAGRIKDLHDEDGLLEVDFTPFQMNNKTLLSGIKCHPGWTLIGNTCFMYFGGPMTYKQAEEFCLKDNSSMPFVKDTYMYHSLTQYLETSQDDWRYYDMVWVKHLDSGIGDCTVLVDGSVKTVSCDFLLPTICENDPHPEPRDPFDIINITQFNDEVVYVLVAGVVGIILIFIVCFLWCSKSRRRKKERFERRNSIRMSKSSLAGSRSLASVASTGFSDINYRRRVLNNSKQGTMISTSPYGGSGTIRSTATVLTGGLGHGASMTVTAGQSYDSLADKRSLALHSNADDDIRSYDIYEAHNASRGTFGSHLSPNTTAQTFADMHEIHYAHNSANVAAQSGAINNGFRHDAAPHPPVVPHQAIWGPNNLSSGLPLSATPTSVGPPGYMSSKPNSVLDIKKEIVTTSSSEVESSSSSGSSNDPQSQQPQSDYYTSMTYDSFRPQQQQQQQQQQHQQPYHYKFGSTSGLPPPPEVPPPPPSSSPPPPTSSSSKNQIPSVPGYAKPFAQPHNNYDDEDDDDQENRQRFPLSASTRLLETSLDNDDNFRAVPVRSRSMGQMLETNFDDPIEPTTTTNSSLINGNHHSQSVGGLSRLTMSPSLLESDL